MKKGKSAREKGKEGEREAGRILSEILGVDGIKRNLMAQARDGGTDLTGLKYLAVEVKRQETLSLPARWRQTCQQAPSGKIPLLMFRRNRTPWYFVLPYSKAESGFKIYERAEAEPVLRSIEAGEHFAP